MVFEETSHVNVQWLENRVDLPTNLKIRAHFERIIRDPQSRGTIIMTRGGVLGKMFARNFLLIAC
jgi:hypothetical protein